MVIHVVIRFFLTRITPISRIAQRSCRFRFADYRPCFWIIAHSNDVSAFIENTIQEHAIPIVINSVSITFISTKNCTSLDLVVNIFCNIGKEILLVHILRLLKLKDYPVALVPVMLLQLHILTHIVRPVRRNFNIVIGFVGRLILSPQEILDSPYTDEFVCHSHIVAILNLLIPLLNNLQRELLNVQTENSPYNDVITRHYEAVSVIVNLSDFNV